MSNNIVEIVPSKTDKDFAEELKSRIVEAYKPLLEVLSDADRYGFIVNCTVGKDGLGRISIVQLQILKGF